LHRITKILLVDDHELILDGLEKILHQSSTAVEVFRATTTRQLTDQLIDHFVDLVFLDINLQGTNMLDYIDKIRAHNEFIKIIVLTSYDNQSLLNEALDKKVHAYLTKNSTKQQILNAMNEVLQGKRYINAHGTKNHETNLNDDFLKKNNLTAREIEVLKLLAKGYTNSKISKELYISIHTILSHRKNIFRKLGMHSINELLHFAYSNGLS